MVFLAGAQKWVHTIIFLICVFSSQNVLGFLDGKPMFCPDVDETSIAWQFNPTNHNLFDSNMIETFNKRVSKRDKKRRIMARIKANHHQRVHAMPLSDDELAEIIIWAADCTQNDFQVFTGMLEVESYICGDRTGPDGDRGCSMFTNSPIKVFKNQMKLPGRTDNGAQIDVGNRMKQMITGCYTQYNMMRVSNKQKGSAEGFIELFSGSRSGVKTTFLNGNHLHYDILAGAIYLKFKSALAGGYWPNKTAGVSSYYRNRGGVYLYNSSKRAKAHSNKVKRYAENVNLVCFEDNYTNDVLEAMCAIEDDVDFCLDNLERGQQYEI